MSDRFKKVRTILIYVLILNLVVSLVKIVFGSLTNTLSIKADGYHSLFDGISNVVGIIGIHIASKPADKNHPYGHQKYETMASVAIAMLLVFVGFEILYNAFDRFLDGESPDVTSISFIVMVATMAVNLFVTIYENRKGRLLGSEILIADSLHTRSDIYVSLSVIAGLVGINLGYPVLDPFIALIIAAIIMRAGITIIRRSSYTLCDVSRIDEHSVCCITESIDGVIGCHKVRTRGSPRDVHMDLHINVDPELTVDEAHLISHRVGKELKKYYKSVTEVMVHIEPGKK